MISVHFQGKQLINTVIQVYTTTSKAEEAEVEWFYEYLQDLLELTHKKDVLFIIGDWNTKVERQENTCRNRQIWPWSTECSRAKANRVLPREHTGHSKHHLPTTEEDSMHGYHQMVNTNIRLIIFFAAKDGEALYSQQKQDQHLLVARIMNSLLPNSDKLKKVGKTTRPFKYDLNQIPYNYTVEVRNTFKGLDLIECLKNYGQRFMTLYRTQESRPSPRKRNAKKQNGCLGRSYK